VADLVNHATAFGIVKGTTVIDMRHVRQRKGEMVDGLITMHLDQYRASGAELIMGAERVAGTMAAEAEERGLLHGKSTPTPLSAVLAAVSLDPAGALRALHDRGLHGPHTESGAGHQSQRGELFENATRYLFVTACERSGAKYRSLVVVSVLAAIGQNQELKTH
jgi:hypothetical protein